jgi:hypothetical protein
MKPPKKAITLRLSDKTTQELASLAKNKNLSQADVISVLVHCAYQDLDWDDLDQYFDIARLA